MGQDTSGTSLTTNAAATGRTPSFRFLVDWHRRGFSDVSGWIDESAYVKSIRGEMQATDWQRSIATVGRGVSDVVYVTCQNPEETGSYSGFRFSPSNVSSYLYAPNLGEYAIGEGYGLMIRAIVEMGFSGERLRQITGYIVGIRENYGRKEVVFEIRDRAADATFTRTSTALYTDTSAKTYLEALSALFERDAVATADQQFDDGVMVIPYAWMDDERIWDEMDHVAVSQMGRIWFDKDGDLHFDDAAHWVKPHDNSWDDPTTSQATFTVSSFREVNPHYDLGSVFSHVIVEYQPRYVGVLQVIYGDSEMHVIRPLVSTGSNVKTLEVEFRYPVSSVVTPEADTDYEASSAGALDLTDDVTLALTDYAGSSSIQITNSHANFAAYMTKLQLRGYPLLTEQSMKYETEDATSISYFGRRTWTVRQNPYVQNYRHAEMIGDYLLQRFKAPVQRIQLRGVPALPWLEVGDRITVRETLTGINTDYFIATIRWAFVGGGYTMDIDGIRCTDLLPYTDYFILGTSYYGTGTGRGRLFW